MDKDYIIKIRFSEYQRLLGEIDRLQSSLERIERYTDYELNGLEYIRDEVLLTLDKF